MLTATIKPDTNGYTVTVLQSWPYNTDLKKQGYSPLPGVSTWEKRFTSKKDMDYETRWLIRNYCEIQVDNTLRPAFRRYSNHISFGISNL